MLHRDQHFWEGGTWIFDITNPTQQKDKFNQTKYRQTVMSQTSVYQLPNNCDPHYVKYFSGCVYSITSTLGGEKEVPCSGNS